MRFTTCGRGRGRGRGRARARGRGGRNALENGHQDAITPPTTADEESSEDEISEDESDGDEDESEKTAKPYNALLSSLTAATAAANSRKPERNSKRRKLEHVVTEEVAEEEQPIEDEEEAANDHDAEAAEDGVVDGEEEEADHPADPFETHFAVPSPDFLAQIQEAKSNEWDTARVELPEIGRAIVSVSSGAQRPRITDLHLKKKLQDETKNWSPLQKALSNEIFAYMDVMYTQRTVTNAQELRELYVLHALNHILKTRDKVLKNNARLSGKDDGEIELRDQGFTRPKVLFLLPTRNSCVKVAETITKCLNIEQQENKKRFEDSFFLPPSEDRLQSSEKPADFLDLFSGNHDDAFRLGLKLTRKTLKFFSAFYNSDIIVASPLGLRLAIGDEADKKKYDYDFLSSIELVVMDQTDALLQQNWEHVEYIFSHLNRLPKESHGCDMGRVREWYLDTNARFLRQTLIFSSFLTPELNALWSSSCMNIAGKVRTQTTYAGVIDSLVSLPVKQIFTRFSSTTPSSDPDERFAFFTSAIVPSLLRRASGGEGGVLLIANSYIDFVRVRNHLATLDLSVGAISEETPVPEVSRARAHFLSGRHSVLLYTHRAHHFRRYVFKGVKEAIFLKVPDNPAFYQEVVRMVAPTEMRGKVRVAFSKWDAVALERIVGTKRVGTMVRDIGDTFEFV